MAVPYNHVSRDAALALTEFSDAFKDALAISTFTPWAAQLGYLHTSDALKTVWPVPVDAIGYRELLDDMQFDALASRSMSMIGKRFQGGVEEYEDVITAPDFVGWMDKPAAFASEWERLPNDLVAKMLAQSSFAGPLLSWYQDSDTNTPSTTRLFAAGHPYNVLAPELGTFDNRLECTTADIQSGAIFDEIDQHFGSILRPFKGDDGDEAASLGLSLIGGNVLVPYQMRSLFKRVLEFDTLISAVSADGVADVTSGAVAAVTRNNIYKNTFGYTPAFELRSPGYFYAIAAPRAGMFPWVVQKQPVKEILHDTSSELYKRKLKLGVAYHGKANCAGLLPHPIVRVRVTDIPL